MAKKPAAGKSTWTDKLTFQNIGIAAVIYIALKLCGVFQFYGPYWGRVVDAETGQPIEGAGVLATYVRYVPVLSGPEAKGSQEAFTDESGYFFLWPRLVLDMPVPFYVFQWAPVMVIAKEGYHVSGTYFKNQDEPLFKVYGLKRKIPTPLGPMVIELRKLKREYDEYRQYSTDFGSCTGSVGPAGRCGVIFGFFNDTGPMSFREMALRESKFGYEQMKKFDRQ